MWVMMAGSKTGRLSRLPASNCLFALSMRVAYRLLFSSSAATTAGDGTLAVGLFATTPADTVSLIVSAVAMRKKALGVRYEKKALGV